MASKQEILATLGSVLGEDPYRGDVFTDESWNGVQVEGSREEITKIGLAVDAGLSVLETAAQQNCDLVIVHHGLFWGQQSPQGSPQRSPIVGALRDKVSLLLREGITLFCSHLPLDGNQQVGNGAELARALGLQDIEPYFQFRGNPVGASGRFPLPIDFSEVKELLCSALTIPEHEVSVRISSPSAPISDTLLALQFGVKEISSVAIITGSGTFALPEVSASGFDLYITGEPKQEAYHLARDLKANVLFGGHYATETFGVRALGKLLTEKFKISSVFLDEPTGI